MEWVKKKFKPKKPSPPNLQVMREIKLLLLGNGGMGKTSLIHYYETRGKGQLESDMTIR